MILERKQFLLKCKLTANTKAIRLLSIVNQYCLKLTL